MAEQIQKQPSFRRDDENHGVYDDGFPAGGSSHGQEVSQGAQNSLDDIDSLLNDVAAGEAAPAATPADEATKKSAADDLKQAEQNFTGPGGFRDEGAAGGTSFVKRAGNFVLRRKRGVAIGGGIAGLGIGGVMTFSGLLVGPLQISHLGHLLLKNNDSSNSASANRLNKLFRFARATDVGDTRVGYTGKKVFGKTIQQLKDVGIEFDRNARTGNPKSMMIDTSKNPELKGMSRDQARAAIAEKFGLPENTIYRINTGSAGGDKFAINTRDIGIKATRALTKNSLTYLENGKIVSSIRFRVLADYFNTPSLFHPLEKAKASVQNKYATAAERRATEEKRAQDLERSTNADATAARAEMKDKMSGTKDFAAKALLFTAGMCMVRSVADDVVTINRAAIVVPAVLQAVDKEAVDSQVSSSNDFNSKQFDAVSESLVDKSGSVFDGRALRSLDGNQVSGPDLSPDYIQAFSGDTTAAHIKSFLGGGSFGEVACSTVGQVVQGVAGAALLVSGLFDAGASWGAKAAQATAETVATAGAMAFIEHQAAAILSDSAIIPKVFSGPLGGNLLAYGAREASNTDIRAAGGIALSATEEFTYSQQQNQIDMQQFKSKNFFARMFDTHDDRSGVSRLAFSLNPNVLQNFTSFSSTIANLPSSLPNSLVGLLPKAHAAEKTYNWGFPKYGIPQSMLDDTTTEDPYDNAAQVAAMLDSGSGQSYIDKAKTCFGVTISKDSGMWDAKPSNPINPTSDDYTGADCSNRSDSMWRRIILFVFDTRTMKAAACYQGDDASCDYSGFGQATTSNNPTDTTGTLPSGSAKDIATQLLPYIKSNKINCSGQATNCPDIQMTAAGQSLKGVGSCYVDALDPQLLGIILAMAQKGHDFVLSAICSDHPSNPNSKHHVGKGVDFNIVDGVWLGQGGAITWTGDKLTAGKNLDQDIATIAPAGTGFGQVECHPAFAFLQPFVQFDDVCHHQHIQVP